MSLIEEGLLDLVDASALMEIMKRDWKRYLPYVVSFVEHNPDVIDLTQLTAEDIFDMPVKDLVSKIVNVRQAAAAALGPTGASIVIEALESLKGEASSFLKVPAPVSQSLINATQRALRPIADRDGSSAYSSEKAVLMPRSKATGLGSIQYVKRE